VMNMQTTQVQFIGKFSGKRTSDLNSNAVEITIRRVMGIVPRHALTILEYGDTMISVSRMAD
uniref:hypothetical protein n=1 Tax=Syntrophomonas palmitatica TaxID=402877 RepID=UPI00155DBE54